MLLEIEETLLIYRQLSVQLIDSPMWLVIDAFVTSGSSTGAADSSFCSGISYVLRCGVWLLESEMVFYYSIKCCQEAWWKVKSLGSKFGSHTVATKHCFYFSYMWHLLKDTRNHLHSSFEAQELPSLYPDMDVFLRWSYLGAQTLPRVQNESSTSYLRSCPILQLMVRSQKLIFIVLFSLFFQSQFHQLNSEIKKRFTLLT